MDSDIAGMISSVFSLNKLSSLKPYLKRKPNDNEDEEFYQQFFAKRKSQIPKSLVAYLKSQKFSELKIEPEITPPVDEYNGHLVIENDLEIKVADEILVDSSLKRNQSIEAEVELQNPDSPIFEHEDDVDENEAEVTKQTDKNDYYFEETIIKTELISEEIDVEQVSDKTLENTSVSLNEVIETSCIPQETYGIETNIPDVIHSENTTDFTITLNDKEFKELFHVSKSTVELICTKISPILGTFYMDKIHKDLFNIVLISLNFLSSQQPLETILERFDVTKSEFESFLLNFCRSVSQMHDEFIRWPVEEEFEQNELTFKTIGTKDLNGVFGVIDSQGFKILPQTNNPNLFLNTNGIPNVYVQGVCNANHLFLDCFVGWPGSFSKTNVLENSPIYRKLERSLSSIPTNFHLIGNTYYQSKPYLLTPYSNDDLKPSQLRFNNLLQSKLVVFNETVAMLKDRFQRLFCVDILILEDVKNLILTACCLHNLCIEQRDFYESESDEDHLEKRDMLAASIKF